jgi:hypothetical protein
VVVPPPAEPFAGASGTMSSQMAGIMEKLEALQQSSDGAGDGSDKKARAQPPLPSEGGPPVPGTSETTSDGQKPAQPEAPKEIEYNEDGLPIRPGVQKCIGYLKTGRCSERNCRWDHPIGMGGVMNSSAYASMPGLIGGLMTEGALAMRPGRDQCPFLAKTNTCPFGPECRFDHSGGAGGSNAENASKPTPTLTPAAPKKKDRGLGGTRGKRPPPRRY